ncbi:helix-turn-helix domain-containing protein, partial [Lactococcus lactis]
MIINKLNLLLAERFIKASKLAKDTGIAQSTISKIVNNATSQIDYSTLDKICLYLKIT